MNIKIKIIIITFVCIMYLFYFRSNKSTNENFYTWNLPTRGLLPIYDIRGYPLPYKYIKYNDSIYPYYSNDMIYNATGSYKQDELSKYKIPIIYPYQYDTIDVQGLVNNGVIKIK